MKKVFKIVLVGSTNVGKSTLVSTLTFDENIEIKDEQDTTVYQDPVKLHCGDRNFDIEIVDTPGFGHVQELKELLSGEHREKREKLLKKFIREHERDTNYQVDCEILKAIEGNDVVIYVIDSEVKPKEKRRAEMEFVKLVGNSRLALINKKGNKKYLKEHQEWLKDYFDVIWSFDPHAAEFKNVIEFMDKVLNISNDIDGKDIIQGLKRYLNDKRKKNFQKISILIYLTLHKISSKSFTSEVGKSEKWKDVREKLSERLKDYLKEERLGLCDSIQSAWGREKVPCHIVEHPSPKVQQAFSDTVNSAKSKLEALNPLNKLKSMFRSKKIVVDFHHEYTEEEKIEYLIVFLAYAIKLSKVSYGYREPIRLDPKSLHPEDYLNEEDRVKLTKLYSKLSKKKKKTQDEFQNTIYNILVRHL